MRTSDVAIRKPRPADYSRIGELVYAVDPFIYPALFGSIQTAHRVMPLLMSVPNSPFASERVHIALVAGDIAGLAVFYLEPFDELPDLSIIYEGCEDVPVSCKDVCLRYLLPMCSEVGYDDVYIACLVTDPRYRKRGVATRLIDSIRGLSGGRRLSLDVLKDNAIAISFYENMGFGVVSEAIGYAYQAEEPHVLRMEAM